MFKVLLSLFCAAVVLGADPTKAPTSSPTTSAPTNAPTSAAPTTAPTDAPTASPTKAPTSAPTSSAPTDAPTSAAPTAAPTKAPTSAAPTTAPTKAPTTTAPTEAPTSSAPTAPSKAPTGTPTVDESILKAIGYDSDLSKFASAINASADLKKLMTSADVLVFAPSNKALASVVNPSDDALEYHVVTLPGGQYSLVEGLNVVPTNDNDKMIKVVKHGNTLTLTGAPSVSVTTNGLPLDADNGVLYVVDKVLLPPVAFDDTAAGLGLSTLLQLLNRTNITLNAAPVTIFAPTDAAFEAFLKKNDADAANINTTVAKQLLLEHVYTVDTLYSTALLKRANLTMGGKTWDIKDGTIGGATITNADQLIANGVVHVIDRVLGGPAATVSTDGLTGGEVVAIVIGVLAGVAIIGYCCFRSSKRDDDYQPI